MKMNSIMLHTHEGVFGIFLKKNTLKELIMKYERSVNRIK